MNQTPRENVRANMEAQGYVVERVAPVEAVGHQLGNRERFDDVIVGADRKAANPLDLLAALVLDRETRRVRRGSRDIHLGPIEFRLLEYLLEKRGRVFSRAQLLDGIWGRTAEIDERTVDVHIGRLRKRLSKGRDCDPIRTVRNMGYGFDEGFGKP